MRILFVLDRVENAASANALMGFRLAEQLVACDHSVHILTLWDGLHTPPAPPEGVVQHLLAFADERLMNEALENGQLVLKRPRRDVDTQREIERLDAEFHYDAVCAVCAPYRAAFALEEASIGGKKYLWQLDPYASNRDYTAPGGFAREGRLLDALDGTFITPQAAPDYADDAPLANWCEKTHVLGFPTLLPGAVRRRCRPAGGQNGRKICAPGDALARRRRRTGKQRGCSGEPGQRLRQSDAEQAVRLFCHRKAGLAPGRERE